ncbi:MAG: nucleotidyltransferase family protein [Rhodobacteraceae bacterium]|nr:nucleotidyltransferase family protein [Paracoccaceae bacterium]
MPHAIRLVLLAAGGSTRMRGRDKLLETVDGVALLRRQASAMLASRVGPVAVTLAPDRPDRKAAIEGLAINALTIADAAQGMSGSLRAAAHWAAGNALLVAPADMPDLTSADFRAAARAFDGLHPLRATGADGTPGHPVIFPAPLLPLFDDLRGDDGARAILRKHPPVLLALPGDHALTDLDTPEAWDAWRARTEGPSRRT